MRHRAVGGRGDDARRSQGRLLLHPGVTRVRVLGGGGSGERQNGDENENTHHESNILD